MSLDELPEEDREAAFVLRAKHAIEISPRPLMLQFREFCDKPPGFHGILMTFIQVYTVL